MTHHNQNQRREFEYILEDFLEVKAALGRHKTQPLKQFLLSQRRKDFVLSGVEGFCLHPQLVLIGSKNPASFEHLVFLNPHTGTIRVRRLAPEPPPFPV